MPIYDYVCADCGERTEVMHSVHAAGPDTCAACGGRLRKALSSPAIVFKGSGWAKKDARSASGKSAAKESQTPASETAATAEGGSSTGKEATATTGD